MSLWLGIWIITRGREAASRTFAFLNVTCNLTTLYLAQLLHLSGGIIFTAVTELSVVAEMRVTYFSLSYP